MTDLVIKNPDGSYATTDATNLKGHNWHRTIRASDGTIPEEDIKRYYDIAMKLEWQDGWYSSEEMKAEAKTPGYKHIHLGGSDTSREEYEIEQDWVKEMEEKRWESILKEYEQEFEEAQKSKALKFDKKVANAIAKESHR